MLKKLSKVPREEDNLTRAIRSIKRSHLKGTHVKVELEADIGRHWDEDECETFLLESVSADARDSLTFYRFYNDGSVDSELTFTVPLDKAKYVPEFISAFKKLSTEAGCRLNVEGAGMHIAILNDKQGVYPGGNSLNSVMLKNFTKSVEKLLPALYFLGSSDAKSRSLHYRQPMISSRYKYSAISAHRGVLEYRLFETCYDKPEMFIDYMCVIAKTLQFYSPKFIDIPILSKAKIGQIFLSDYGYDLQRFFKTTNNLKALDCGLAVLKPDHKTIAELKKERNFKLNNTVLKRREHAISEQSKKTYLTDKQRFNALRESYREVLVESYRQSVKMHGKAAVSAHMGPVGDYVARELANWDRQNIGHLKSLKSYVDKKIADSVVNPSAKSYTLTI